MALRLSCPAQITHVPFHNPKLLPPTRDNSDNSIELITWHIPAHMDPAFDHHLARELNALLHWMDTLWHSVTCSTGFGKCDLGCLVRGWSISSRELAAIADSVEVVQDERMEKKVSAFSLRLDRDPKLDYPTSRTHFFLLCWQSQDVEARFKDPTQPSFGGFGFECESNGWEDHFERFQKDWVQNGMKVEQCHLKLKTWYDDWDSFVAKVNAEICDSPQE